MPARWGARPRPVLVALFDGRSNSMIRTEAVAQSPLPPSIDAAHRFDGLEITRVSADGEPNRGLMTIRRSGGKDLRRACMG